MRRRRRARPPPHTVRRYALGSSSSGRSHVTRILLLLVLRRLGALDAPRRVVDRLPAVGAAPRHHPREAARAVGGLRAGRRAGAPRRARASARRGGRGRGRRCRRGAPCTARGGPPSRAPAAAGARRPRRCSRPPPPRPPPTASSRPSRPRPPPRRARRPQPRRPLLRDRRAVQRVPERARAAAEAHPARMSSASSLRTDRRRDRRPAAASTRTTHGMQRLQPPTSAQSSSTPVIITTPAAHSSSSSSSYAARRQTTRSCKRKRQRPPCSQSGAADGPAASRPFSTSSEDIFRPASGTQTSGREPMFTITDRCGDANSAAVGWSAAQFQHGRAPRSPRRARGRELCADDSASRPEARARGGRQRRSPAAVAMPKTRFSSLDVRAIATQLQNTIVGYRIANVYDINAKTTCSSCGRRSSC